MGLVVLLALHLQMRHQFIFPRRSGNSSIVNCDKIANSIEDDMAQLQNDLINRMRQYSSLARRRG